MRNKRGKAYFLFGQTFWETFCAFRACWLRGRYGGGKTLLAVAMAARLLAEEKVNKVVSNIPLSFSVPPPENNLKDAAILLDESWIYINTRQDSLDYAAFVRKFNTYLLFPSVFPIHNRLSFFFVQRVFNAYSVGLPFWVYEYGIRDKVVKEKGLFALVNPTALFGHYPTLFVAGDDNGISKALKETSKNEGYKGTRQQQAIYNPFLGDEVRRGVGVVDDIEETLDDFTYSLDSSVSDMEEQARKIIRSIRK